MRDSSQCITINRGTSGIRIFVSHRLWLMIAFQGDNTGYGYDACQGDNTGLGYENTVKDRWFIR